MNSDHWHRGKLFSVAASLLFFLSTEILKWQDPVFAASEKLVALFGLLRIHFSQTLS